MGTDIHIGVEVKAGYSKAEPWRGVLPPPGRIADGGEVVYDNRHYALFCFLSGVRYGCTMKGMIQERGLPEDRDRMARYGTWSRIGNTGMAVIWFREPNPEPQVERGREWDGYFGDYGYTWATVGELLALPWFEASGDFEEQPSMRSLCADFIAWLEELKYLFGADTCRLIWGFDS